MKGETGNASHLHEDNYTPCASVLSKFSKNLLVNTCDSLLGDTFEVIKRSGLLL